MGNRIIGPGVAAADAEPGPGLIEDGADTTTSRARVFAAYPREHHASDAVSENASHDDVARILMQ